MPNIGKVLKDEILRLAKKESKGSTSVVHKDTVALKKTVASLKRQITQLQRDVRQLLATETKRKKLEPAVSPEKAEKLRFSAKGIRALRRKLKLSQADFAKLVGVSSLAVYQWERKEGRLALRGETRNKLAAIKGLGRKEALKHLEEVPGIEKDEKPQKPGKRGGKRAVEKPLAEYIQEVLKKEKAGMGINEIAEAVQKVGYKTASKKFSNVITILLGKDKRFKRVERGVFKLA